MKENKKSGNCYYFCSIYCPEQRNKIMTDYIVDYYIPKTGSSLYYSNKDSALIDELCAKCEKFKPEKEF